MKLSTAYTFNPERNEWVGMVFEHRWFGRKALTIGCMSTEEGIRLWLARVVRTRAWEDGSEPADLYNDLIGARTPPGG